MLDTLLAWDGSYARTAEDGTVDPGVATWDAFRAQPPASSSSARSARRPTCAADEDVLTPLYGGYHHGAPYHYFDATHLESTGLRTLTPAGYRRGGRSGVRPRWPSASTATDPAKWREPRRMYEVGAVGATAPEPMPFFDRGTYEQFVELGP